MLGEPLVPPINPCFGRKRDVGDQKIGQFFFGHFCQNSGPLPDCMAKNQVLPFVPVCSRLFTILSPYKELGTLKRLSIVFEN